MQQHCEAQLRGARTVREGEEPGGCPQQCQRGQAKGDFAVQEKPGESPRPQKSSRGPCRCRCCHPAAPRSRYTRAHSFKAVRARPSCAPHFPRHFPRVGAHKMAVLSRQTASRKSKGTPRSVESIRTGRACPSSSGLKRISEKEAGQGASWMSKKRQDDPNAACSTRLQQAPQPSRQRGCSGRGLNVPPVGFQ